MDSTKEESKWLMTQAFQQSSKGNTQGNGDQQGHLTTLWSSVPLGRITCPRAVQICCFKDKKELELLAHEDQISSGFSNLPWDQKITVIFFPI